jgi:hypothetical protein
VESPHPAHDIDGIESSDEGEEEEENIDDDSE